MIAARRPAALLGILMLASAASMMATDLYAPTLPFLPGLLGTTPEAAQLTLSLHLAAYAAGTLLHGPLSDAHGRRPVLMWGMGALAATSLLCSVATGIGELILFRVFQGLAAAAEGVVVLAIIRDSFAGDAQVRALAWYGVATSVPPALAPVLGAYLFLLFGWRMTFGVIAVVAFIAGLLIAWGVPESRPAAVRAQRPAAVLRAYLSLLAHWRFLRCGLIGGAAVAVPYVFATGGPFVVVEHFGLPVPYFGYLQALLVVCFVAGSLAAGRWAGRIGAPRILGIGVAAFVAGTVLLALMQVSARETLASISFCLALIAFALGPVFATVPKLALDATAVDTGAAAALLIALELALGSAGGLLVGSLYDGTSRPMMVTFVALALLMGLAFRFGRVGPGR